MTGRLVARLLIVAAAALLVAPGGGEEKAGPFYLGNGGCVKCHTEAYRLWLGSPHSRTWVQLHSRDAMPVALAEGWRQGDPMPTETPLCLGCHAGGMGVGDGPTGDGFQIQEGVQCEACHGPAGRLVNTAAGADSLVMDHKVMVKSDSDTCVKCHTMRPSHTRVKARPWDYAVRWRRIQHGLEELSPP